MDGETAQMVFTDPPYNVPIDGHVGGSGAIKHREFAMASGEMTRAEFTAFLTTAFENLVGLQRRRLDPLRLHGLAPHGRDAGGRRGVYAELKNLIVWAKDNGGMGTFYRSRHELIFAFKNGHRAAHQHASSSASTAATAPMSGSTGASTRCGPAGWTSWRCIRRSSRCR